MFKKEETLGYNPVTIQSDIDFLKFMIEKKWRNAY